jgi:hypothetical protein
LERLQTTLEEEDVSPHIPAPHCPPLHTLALLPRQVLDVDILRSMGPMFEQNMLELGVTPRELSRFKAALDI